MKSLPVGRAYRLESLPVGNGRRGEAARNGPVWPCQHPNEATSTTSGGSAEDVRSRKTRSPLPSGRPSASSPRP